MIMIATVSFSIAGGGACQFKANGLPLLTQSPMLAEILTSKFSVQDGGKMGPMDAPFDGGRLYTYMEFPAASVDNEKEKVLVRIHFKRKSKSELSFASLELLPFQE